MNKLVKELVDNNWLKTDRVIRAFEKIDRKDFVLDEKLAGLNTALEIGCGQTISQPLVVAFMLELLDVKKGDKVLDIGSGSAWTTALLSYLSQKKVVGLEIIKELKVFGEKNLSKYNFIRKGIAEIHLKDGKKGFQKYAPYDKILCSAEAKEISDDLKKQLKIGGRIVIPINNAICVFDKISKDGFFKKCYPGFMFVPLV